MVPYVFLSYPRASGGKIEAFKEDLERVIGGRTTDRIDRRHLVTFDRDTEQGDDWQTRLEVGLQNDKAIVVVLDVRYFRPGSDCGKELAAFILRHKNLRLDDRGALVGLTNVLPVLWDKQAAIRDFIPAILRRIEDVPPISGGQNAVNNYTRRGMGNCINRSRRYYEQLIDAFADAILGMPALDPAPNIALENLQNAFEYDWSRHFQKELSGAPQRQAEAREPLGPGASAVFYITQRPLAKQEASASFADVRLIEPPFGASLSASASSSTSTHPAVIALLRTVHASAVLEGQEVFHYAFATPVPAEPGGPASSIAALRFRNVLTMLIVDPALWPRTPATPESSIIENLVASGNWLGPVIIPVLEGSQPPTAADCDRISERVNRRVIPLSGDETSMMNQLRRVFVTERGRVMHAAQVLAPANERPPALVQSTG